MPLASDQVQFSLLYRKHEKNGLLKKAKELGVSVIAYSPLCQGLLTGTNACCCVSIRILSGFKGNGAKDSVGGAWHHHLKIVKCTHRLLRCR